MPDDVAELFLRGILTLEPSDIVVVRVASGSVANADLEGAIRARFPEWRGFVLWDHGTGGGIDLVKEPARRMLYDRFRAEFEEQPERIAGEEALVTSLHAALDDYLVGITKSRACRFIADTIELWRKGKVL